MALFTIDELRQAGRTVLTIDAKGNHLIGIYFGNGGKQLVVDPYYAQRGQTDRASDLDYLSWFATSPAIARRLTRKFALVIFRPAALVLVKNQRETPDSLEAKFPNLRISYNWLEP